VGRTIAVANLLIDLEYELRVMQLWEETPPSPEALTSTEPFCVDTLEFPQWLQWVFLPRMHRLVDQNEPLPPKSEIAPMAEEYFRGHANPHPEIIGVLHGIDEVINDTVGVKP
jgi:uncharacterized protein YqcC (DUF446 family)